MRTYFWALAAGILALACVSACGGAGTASEPPPPTSGGQVRVEIDWPTRERTVPTYANSLKASINTGNGTVTLTINRSGDVGYTGQALFGQLIPAGNQTLVVDAYTQANATGSRIATASIGITVIENDVITVNVSANLQTLVHHLEIDNQPISCPVGGQVQLVGHAENAANQVLLLPPSAFVWSVVAGGQFGSVSQAGLFSGLAEGTATVQLSEPQAGLQVTAPVTVVVPPPPPPVYRIAFVTDRISPTQSTEIYHVNSDGTGLQRLTTFGEQVHHPSFSPDGQKIVFTTNKDFVWNFTDEVYLMNANGTGAVRITNNNENDADPVFSPDGSKIALTRLIGGDWEIFVMNADGTGAVQLTNNTADDTRPAWSPDGSFIVFESDRDGDLEIFRMQANGSSQTQLTTNSADDLAPSYSPDGSYVVFISDRSGPDAVYRMTSAGGGQVRLLNSPYDASDPTYTADGQRIVFVLETEIGVGDLWMMKSDGTGAAAIFTTSGIIEVEPSVRATTV